MKAFDVVASFFHTPEGPGGPGGTGARPVGFGEPYDVDWARVAPEHQTELQASVCTVQIRAMTPEDAIDAAVARDVGRSLRLRAMYTGVPATALVTARDISAIRYARRLVVHHPSTTTELAPA